MKQEQIESVSSEGSGGVKVHLSSGLDIPEDITIDQASRNIYFSDSGKGKHNILTYIRKNIQKKGKVFLCI